jgi:perosamine synthetase
MADTPHSKSRFVPVAEPTLDGNERKYVDECLTSSWISSSGKFIGAFEETFAAYCGVRHAISANNGTTALHLALVGLGLQPGDEVIVPSLTYIASANAVTYCGAKPVFVDNDPHHLNIDPAKIEAKITPRTKGILVVHLYGHPAEMDAIEAIAEKHGLWIAEDAAEAHGAEFRGRRVGSVGACGVFSFFGNKIVTTGEGGMITTNDDALASKLRLYRGQGMDPERRYWFPVVGYNYRMTNIAAAIGLAQMERIESHLAHRSKLARTYDRLLAPLSNRIVLPTTAPWAKHVYWMYTILLAPELGPQRDEIMRRMAAGGVETRPVFYPMHVLPPYAQDGMDLANATDCAARGINLPTSSHMSDEDAAYVCDTLVRAIT